MKITESTFNIELTRKEMLALQKGLRELELLQKKLPDERNGFDIPSQIIVDTIKATVDGILG